MTKLYVLTVLCLSGWAAAQIALDGGCPKVEFMKDFDFSKFVGNWYEIRRTDPAPNRGDLTCITSNYTIQDNGDVRSIWTAIHRYNGRLLSIPSHVYPMDSAKPATIKYRYSTEIIDRSLYVLGTDYKTFSVLYYCKNGSWAHMVCVFIMTREREPADTVMETAYKFVDKIGIPRLMLTKIKQSNCELKADKPMKK